MCCVCSRLWHQAYTPIPEGDEPYDDDDDDDGGAGDTKGSDGDDDEPGSGYGADMVTPLLPGGTGDGTGLRQRRNGGGGSSGGGSASSGLHHCKRALQGNTTLVCGRDV